MKSESDDLFEHTCDMIYYSIRDFKLKNKRLPNAVILSKDCWAIFKTGFCEDELEKPKFRNVSIFVSQDIQGVICCERAR